jgi:serine/threonine-protein kinase
MMYVGRYALFDEIASGGFASVHLGRTVGAGGFARTVAIKRLHRQYARDPEVSAMFLDEAKVVARIRHPNVVPTLDLIAEEDELFLVMEYVEGATLKHLLREARRRQRSVPLGIVLRIVSGALHGLHAAHEARNEHGEPLQLIHRDISPDNILVGVDGLARLLDFGVARAFGHFQSTREGEVKGKLAYLAPEQVRSEALTRKTDIFSASCVLWEAMTGRRLFRARTIAAMAHMVLHETIEPPSAVADTPKKLDGIVMQGLERDPERRWPTARRMAAAIEALGELASQSAVGRYVRQAAADKLVDRSRAVSLVEAHALSEFSELPPQSARPRFWSAPFVSPPSQMPSQSPSQSPPSQPPTSLPGPPRVPNASDLRDAGLSAPLSSPLSTAALSTQALSRRPITTILLAMLAGALLVAAGAALRTPPEAPVHTREPPPVVIAAPAPPAPQVAPPSAPTATAPPSAGHEPPAPTPEPPAIKAGHGGRPGPTPPSLYGRE